MLLSMIFEFFFFIFKIILRSIFGLFLYSDKDLEIALLRKENLILKRKLKKPHLMTLDRFFYLFIYKHYLAILDKIMLVKPETVVSWHKKLVQRKWNYSKRRVGRPPVTQEIKRQIIEMKKANSRWGSKRIMGELKKLGIKLCKRTITRILKEHGFDTNPRKTSYSWNTFLKSQGKRFWACDFFSVETLFLQTLHVFFIIDIHSREIILWRVTTSPCELWLRNLIRSEFCFLANLPDALISDRDGVYGKWLKPLLKEYYGINLVKTPPQMPWFNGHCERMVRTFREDSLDHMLIYNETDLRNVLKEYISYYNSKRSHSSIEYNAPKTDFSTSDRYFHPSKVRREKILDGLLTDFSLAA